MDVLSYFHLSEHPFRLGPDSRFLFFSDQVREAIAKCEYMTRERVGPIYMYGPIGSGKTSILRRLHERVSQEQQFEVAYVISPNIKTSNAFLRVIMDEFHVKTERSYDQSLKNFEAFLRAKYEEGKVPVLLVDEAQNLNRDTLKLIHYLLNYETATTKLLQIVLVGQENLAERILKFRELASRMFPISINPMSVTELAEMISFRWMVGGGQVLPFESDEAIRMLFAYTRGVPRDTIKICDELLRELVAKNKAAASPIDVQMIAQELNLLQLPT